MLFFVCNCKVIYNFYKKHKIQVPFLILYIVYIPHETNTLLNL